MSFGIYKPGQGYWVRTMSAVFLGILFLVGAAWAWDQVESARLPPRAYSFVIPGTAEGLKVEPGAVVRLERAGLGGAFDAIGTATAEEYIPASETIGSSKLIVKHLVFDGDEVALSQIQRVSLDVDGSPVSAMVTTPDRIELIAPLYLQAGAASLVILVGAVVIFWYAGMGKRTVDFLVATDGEMKKVNWSTKKEIIGSTQVVIVAAVLISLILFLIDIGFSNFFKLIGVLES